MTFSRMILLSVCAASLAACGAAESNTHTSEVTPAKAEAPAAAIVLTSSPSDAPSGTYTNDKGHAYITFHYVHQGYSRPFLRWRDWDSTLNWDSENPENSSVSVSIKTESIDTGVDKFDDHMKSDGWMNVAEYPQAAFVSTALSKTSDRTGKMTGDLTIMGITKPVTLDVTFNKAGEGRAPGTYKLGFSATADLMRSDWGLGKYAPAVGDEVSVIIEAEYVMSAAQE